VLFSCVRSYQRSRVTEIRKRDSYQAEHVRRASAKAANCHIDRRFVSGHGFSRATIVHLEVGLQFLRRHIGLESRIGGRMRMLFRRVSQMPRNWVIANVLSTSPECF
jgi:hypothetical protein